MSSDPSPRSRRDDLVAICSLGPDRLRAALHALRTTKPTIKRSNLRRALARAIGDDVADALSDIIFYLALNDRRTRQIESSSLEEFDRNVASVLLDEGQQKAWRECRPIIGEMLLTPVAQIVAKATDLAFDFARLWLTARILTDIRPVFTESRDAIVGAAITQTMRVDYTSPDGDDQTISFALDEKDLKALFNACREALEKAAKAHNIIEESGREAMIVGEGSG